MHQLLTLLCLSWTLPRIKDPDLDHVRVPTLDAVHHQDPDVPGLGEEQDPDRVAEVVLDHDPENDIVVPGAAVQGGGDLRVQSHAGNLIRGLHLVESPDQSLVQNVQGRSPNQSHPLQKEREEAAAAATVVATKTKKNQKIRIKKTRKRKKKSWKQYQRKRRMPMRRKKIQRRRILREMIKKRKKKRKRSLQSLGEADLVAAHGTEKVVDRVHGLAAEGVQDPEAVQGAVLARNELIEQGHGHILGESLAANQDLAEIDPETVVGHVPMNERGGGHVHHLGQRKIHDVTEAEAEIVRKKIEIKKGRRKKIGKTKRKIKGKKTKKRKSQRCLVIMMKKNNWDTMEKMTRGKRGTERKKILKIRMRLLIWIFLIHLKHVDP